MTTRMGGPTPEVRAYGLELPAEVPDNTSASAPVVIGQLFILSGTAADGTGNKLAEATAGNTFADTMLVQAITGSVSMTDDEVITVKVLTGHNMVRVLPCKSGALPTVGQSVQIAAGDVRHVSGKAYAFGQGRVLFVDTVGLTCEVIC